MINVDLKLYSFVVMKYILILRKLTVKKKNTLLFWSSLTSFLWFIIDVLYGKVTQGKD